jgi:putative addiction module component (TIGR02574 family)
MTQATLSTLLRLPKPQCLAVAERLWLSVTDEAPMPVPESHERVLRKRLAEYRAGHLEVVSHEALMRRVRES